uniref:Uncharacterized protein n=1 Tax=Brassica campestris TaxID=3711 RepID=M4DKU8_BRACM
MKTTSSGYLTHETASNMEYMLGYHEIDFDTITEIIEEASAVAAHNIPTLNDPTHIDFDIIVKINDLNPDALRRIDLLSAKLTWMFISSSYGIIEGIQFLAK